MKYEILAIGTSAGGIDALKRIFKDLNNINNVGVIVIQHLSANSKSYLKNIISDVTNYKVEEIEDKMELKKGVIYVAPQNYHVLVEKDTTFTLITTEKVSYARPSIDVCFESIADTFGDTVVGVILTGANQDGSKGLKQIKVAGGHTIVQKPETAESPEMPLRAIEMANPQEILELEEIGKRLNEILRLE